MLQLIIFLCFLIFSVWFGVEVVNHPGYLLLVYQPWLVQMPLWFALLSTIIIFALFYIIINVADRLQFFSFKIKNYFRFRREQKSYSKTQHGFSALIEGRYKQAEQLLLAGVNQTVEPLINYLGAARAAHEQTSFDRRDLYLRKAYEVAPHDYLAIALTQAELEMSQHQFEQAAATLHHLREKAPRHHQVLKLMEKVYVHLGDWQGLLKLLPSLRKEKILTQDELEQFEKNLYSKMLQRGSPHEIDALHSLWETIPRNIKKNPDVIDAYVRQLKSFPDTNKEVENLIRQALKKNWQPNLVNCYGELPFTNLNRQLIIADAWLKMYGSRPELLLLLGKLCVQVQLWGKAKDYFEKCIDQYPDCADAYLEYGKLLEQLNEPMLALQKYKQGLSKTHKRLPVSL